MLTQTASYVVAQYNLVTILKELTYTKQMNYQLRMNVQATPLKQNPSPQPAAT